MIRLCTLACVALALSGMAAAQEAQPDAALGALRKENAALKAELARLAEAVAGIQRQLQGDQQGRPGLYKIGVVDIGVLFKSYTRKDALETEINAERDSMKAEMERSSTLVKERRARFDSIPEDEQPLEGEKIKKQIYDLELKQQRYQSELKKQVEQNTLTLLSEIEATVQAYGKQYAYTLILKVDSSPSVGDPEGTVENFQERIFRAQISDVLYRDAKALDLTKNVLVLLNSRENLLRMKRMTERRAKSPGKPSGGF